MNIRTKIQPAKTGATEGSGAQQQTWGSDSSNQPTWAIPYQFLRDFLSITWVMSENRASKNFMGYAFVILSSMGWYRGFFTEKIHI